MKSVAVIGSRSFADYDLLQNTLMHYKICKIISGGAKGADSLAERYATNHGIELVVFKPA